VSFSNAVRFAGTASGEIYQKPRAPIPEHAGDYLKGDSKSRKTAGMNTKRQGTKRKPRFSAGLFVITTEI
jgi:hypothetical protein